MLARVVNSRLWQSRPTWNWEVGFAALYLVTITLATTRWEDPRHATGQAFCLLAALLTFAYVAVATRLEEGQEEPDAYRVECHRRLTQYLVGKELAWLIGFAALKAWTAMGGIPLFLMYPSWRRVYRRARRRP